MFEKSRLLAGSSASATTFLAIITIGYLVPGRITAPVIVVNASVNPDGKDPTAPVGTPSIRASLLV